MIKSLYDKFKHWSEGGSVWLISDTHFGDEESREMNPNYLPAVSPETYVNILNKQVQKQDTLICLGDVGDISWVKKIKAGYKVLIKGNHDDKGDSYYKGKVDAEFFPISEWNIKGLREHLTAENPDATIDLKDYSKGEYFKPPYIEAIIDNNLFDEVYNGALFISDKILLSHEPINGLKFCTNIHGHWHNGVYDYTDHEGGRHLNIAADVVDYQVLNLAELIKAGLVSKLPTIHRLVIDKRGGSDEKENEKEMA